MASSYVNYGIAMVVIGLAGLVGNTLSILVMSNSNMKTSINCILVGLAIFDNLVILLSITVFGTWNLCLARRSHAYLIESRACYDYHHVVPYIEVYGLPCAYIAQTGSVLLTVAVTIERYVAVCFPLRARSLCTYSRARIYVVTISFFSILYNLPHFWDSEIYEKVIRDLNLTITTTRHTWLYENKYYYHVYYSWMYQALIYFIPLVMLIVLNVVIWINVRRANRERRDMSGQDKAEAKLTIMLSSVVAVYLICSLLEMTEKILQINGYRNKELREFCDLFLVINSSVNFVIYCLFGQQFRRNLFRMFNACWHGCSANDVHVEESVKTDTFAQQQNHSNSACNATTHV